MVLHEVGFLSKKLVLPEFGIYHLSQFGSILNPILQGVSDQRI